MQVCWPYMTLHDLTLEPRVTFVANSKCEFLPHDQVFPVVEKFSTSIWHKPFSVKVTLKISVQSAMVHGFLYFFELDYVLMNPFWVQCWDFCLNQNRCSYENKILNLKMLNGNSRVKMTFFLMIGLHLLYQFFITKLSDCSLEQSYFTREQSQKWK